MAWSFTLNGNTYTDAQVEPYGYREAFPLIFADMAAAISGMSAQYTIANSNYQAFLAAVASGPVVGVSGMTGAVALANPNHRIINGDFRIAQRGTSGSITTSGTLFVADRWTVFAGGITGTLTVTQVAASDLVFGENISAYLELNIPAGGGNVFLYQRIEDAHTFGGLRGVITIAVWSQAATTIDRVDIQRVYGTGGSAPDVLGRVNNVALIAGWNKFQVPFFAADSSAKTFGPGSYISAGIQPKLTSTDAKLLRFARVWPDDNNGAQSPTGGRFGERNLQQEQALCERYYERVPVENTFTATAAGQVFRVSYPLVRKAKNPALTRAVAGTLTNCTVALEAGPDPTGGFTLALTAAAAGLVSITGATVAADAEL